MSTEALASGETGLDIASVRIGRLAFGTAACLCFAEAAGWTLSFIAPVMTLFLLSLPTPAPSLKNGIGLIAAVVVSFLVGLMLLPRMLHQPLVGLLLLGLFLYWSFYIPARGGSPLVGALLTLGLAFSTAIGTVSIDLLLLVVKGVLLGTVVGVIFVWIAHAVLPDSLAGQAAKGPQQPPAAATPPDLANARWGAFRALMIVLPVGLWFLLSGASFAYAPVMVKVATMGQQATRTGTRDAARSLIMSTVIGGVGAIIGWQVLRIAPTLPVYVLFVGLAGLVTGRYIFRGAGPAPDAATWSYGYLTMLVILAPAVMDTAFGSAAGVAFLDRLWMFLLATLYGVAAVYVVDALRPRPASPGSGAILTPPEQPPGDRK